MIMLNNIWHGFSVCPWRPRVLWQAVTLWLVNNSAIRALGYNRYVTGRRSRDENHAVRFRQNGENRSRARDTQPIRNVSDKLAMECKHWHPLTPRRRYGQKKSSLWVYVFYPSLTYKRNIKPFENKVWELYFLLRSVFFRSLNCVNGYTTLRCSTRPHEWGTHWESKSLVNVC